MWITNAVIGVDESSIDPRLHLKIDFHYHGHSELPITFHGYLKSRNGKRLATIDCGVDTIKQSILSIPTVDQDRHGDIKRNIETKYSRDFTAVLSPKSIDYIEDQRTSDPTKNVFLVVEMEMIQVGFQPTERRELGIEKNTGSWGVEIEQSKWLKHFAPYLGIGNFMIIEFSNDQIKAAQGIKHTWLEKIDRAIIRLGEMHTHLREGQWYTVMEDSRKIWDVFKLHKDDKEAKEELRVLFEENNFSDQGYDYFISSIYFLHEFTSKFIHDKGKKSDKELNPILVSKKEDAYFMYMWCMGFINLLNEKIRNLDNEKK